MKYHSTFLVDWKLCEFPSNFYSEFDQMPNASTSIREHKLVVKFIMLLTFIRNSCLSTFSERLRDTQHSFLYIQQYYKHVRTWETGPVWASMPFKFYFWIGFFLQMEFMFHSNQIQRQLLNYDCCFKLPWRLGRFTLKEMQASN